MTRLATPIFDHAHPINFCSAFNCYEHVSTCQKSVYSICSSFRQSILEFHHMTGHIHFWPYQSLNFQCPFNLHEFARACKKSVNSWDTVNLRVLRPDLLNLLWRNSSFRNYAIWLAESILAYISGTRFFPNIGFVQEHNK